MGTLEEAEKSLTAMGENLDMFFMIINAIIIFFMQCGFAFLECGAVRAKNATNILIKNMLDAFIAGIAYYLIGLAFAFGEGNVFIGWNYFVAEGLPENMYAFWFFHYVFAATAATIVSGAVAERCEFVAYGCYSFLITGVVYPVVTHWAWSSEGWLAQGYTVTKNETDIYTVAYQDFAGSGVVHLLGGVCALVGCAFLGPRTGRFVDGRPNDILGHSVPLAALGGFILFMGFFAFNGGSQASISQEGDGAAIALSCVNTILSGSAAAFSSMMSMKIYNFAKKGAVPTYSLLTTINGGLAGMVAICAGCNVVYPWGAVVIGLIAGWTYLFYSWAVLKMKLDDPLDAIAVHGGGGLWGVIATPILAQGTGIVFNITSEEAWMALAWNLAGAAGIIGWSAACSLVIFGLLRLFRLFRVDPELEKKGLDIPKHGEPAYPIEAYTDHWMTHYEEEDSDSNPEVRQRKKKRRYDWEYPQQILGSAHVNNGYYHTQEAPVATVHVNDHGLPVPNTHL